MQFRQSYTQPQPIETTKIDTNFIFSPDNTPKVNCYYHPNNILTHFCKQNQMPLCSECTSILQEESQERGTPTQIVPIDNVLTETFAGIADLSNKILEEKENIKIEISKEINEFDATNSLMMIQKAKEQAFELLTTYFDNLEKIAKEQILKQKQVGLNEVKTFEDEVDFQWQEFSRNLEGLNSPDCLPTLIHYFQGDFNMEYQRIQQNLVAQAVALQNRQPMLLDISQIIRYDTNSLSKILTDLHAFVSLKGTQPIESNIKPNPYVNSAVGPRQFPARQGHLPGHSMLGQLGPHQHHHGQGRQFGGHPYQQPGQRNHQNHQGFGSYY